MSVLADTRPRAAALVCAVEERDARAIEDILTQLDTDGLYALAVILADSVDPDRPLTRAVEIDRSPRRVVMECAAEVADEYMISVEDILSRSKDAEILAARHVTCWMAAARGVTSTAIGRALGRDHSTALNSISRVTGTPELRRVGERLMRREAV